MNEGAGAKEVKMKKYELTSETIVNEEGITLYRIKALKDFENVKRGDLGGFVQGEWNLSQEGNAWVGGDAQVFDDALVKDNARVMHKAKVRGKSIISENARVDGVVEVCDRAHITDHAEAYGHAKISGCAILCDHAMVNERAKIKDRAMVAGYSEVQKDAQIGGNVLVDGEACIRDSAKIFALNDYAVIRGFGTQARSSTFYKGKNEIMVKCGCFCGGLDEFRNRIKATRVGKIAKEYLMIADLMKYHFTSEDSDDE